MFSAVDEKELKSAAERRSVRSTFHAAGVSTTTNWISIWSSVSQSWTFDFHATFVLNLCVLSEQTGLRDRHLTTYRDTYTDSQTDRETNTWSWLRPCQVSTLSVACVVSLLLECRSITVTQTQLYILTTKVPSRQTSVEYIPLPRTTFT